MAAEATRLNRYLAACGLGSRRGVEALVAEGRVTIDGVVATRRAARGRGRARHARRPARRAGEHAYVLLQQARRTSSRRCATRTAGATVIDLVGADRRLFPVGPARRRHDRAAAAHERRRPRGAADAPAPRRREDVRGDRARRRERRDGGAAGRGIELDGRRTAPARVRVLRASGRQSVVEIVLHEGRKRQVRRMCEAVGHQVLSLHRSAYAGLRLGTLAPGASRPLLPAELELLRSAARGAADVARRASTATSRSPGSGRGGAWKGSCAPAAWRSTASSRSSPRRASSRARRVTLDGEPVVADGPAGVLVALVGGELPALAHPSELHLGGHVARRPPGGADQRRAAGPPAARARLRPGPPRRGASRGGGFRPLDAGELDAARGLARPLSAPTRARRDLRRGARTAPARVD